MNIADQPDRYIVGSISKEQSKGIGEKQNRRRGIARIPFVWVGSLV